MPYSKPRYLLSTFVALILIALAGAAIAWTSHEGHKYYYPDESSKELTNPISQFTALRAGRYEISYDRKLGDLTFDVSDKDTAKSVPVSDIEGFAQLGSTAGYVGKKFYIERPGSYRISTNPWPPEAKFLISFRNTQAVTYWTIGGLFLACLPTWITVLYLVRRHKLKVANEVT